jgi:hypothetical protein
MGELHTEQLERMIASLITNYDNVLALGVFPADRVPIAVVTGNNGGECALRSCVSGKALRSNVHYCFILNTHEHGRPGEHWLAFFHNCNTNTLEYFDSFGMDLQAYPAVIAALEKRNLLEQCSAVNTLGMVQSTSSSVCGYYCILFLYWRAKHCLMPTVCFMRNAVTWGATAVQRDRFAVRYVRELLTRNAFCCNTDVRGACSQTCRCSGSI